MVNMRYCNMFFMLSLWNSVHFYTYSISQFQSVTLQVLSRYLGLVATMSESVLAEVLLYIPLDLCAPSQGPENKFEEEREALWGFNQRVKALLQMPELDS